jgi:hypothetical protein
LAGLGYLPFLRVILSLLVVEEAHKVAVVLVVINLALHL